MKALVVYESHWGNTAAIARAIAEGLGSGARALSTGEAVGAELDGLDLLVAGAPVHVFGLPSAKTIEGLVDQASGPEPDLSHPSLRSWLESLPHGAGRAAAFETRVRWSPGGAGGAIIERLQRAGYVVIGKAARFIVTGYYGPLRDGELDRARAWGAELAAAAGAPRVAVGAGAGG